MTRSMKLSMTQLMCFDYIRYIRSIRRWDRSRDVISFGPKHQYLLQFYSLQFSLNYKENGNEEV